MKNESKQCQQKREKAFPPFNLHLQLQKSKAVLQTTIQSTVKPSVFPNYSQMDYQTFKPVTPSRQTNKQKTFNRNNFSDQNCNFFAKSKKKNPYTNSQSQPQAQNYNQSVPQQSSNTAFFNDHPQATTDRSKNYPFFQQN